MPSLPPSLPIPMVILANAAVLAVMGGLFLFAKSIDWRYIVGFLVGYFAMYVAVRLKYGFWPFNGS